MTGGTPSGSDPSALGGPFQVALTAWNLAVYAAWMVVPFLLAGSVAWVAGWLHLGVVLTGAVAENGFVARRNPELKERRKQIGAGTKAWDLAWNALYWPLMASIAIVAGAQAGASGSTMSPWFWPAGLVLVGTGFTLSAWAMGTNPYFEGTVRLQVDAGHRVFEGGPYRHVRHPGYLGLVLWALGTPMLLLSVWSIGAAFAAAAWVVLRTGLEDATLQKELPGYAEYTRRTRCRLLPWVW
jgi:protein-S-isoprenylcysteine O-methyltransferase Ste14